MKKLIFFLYLLPLFVFAESEKSIVKIGIIMPLSGDQAFYGTDALKVFTELSKKLSTDYKYSYQLIFEDGHCGMGKAAALAARKLIEVDKVKFILAGCSGEILQAAPITEKAEVLTVCFLCGHPDVSSSGQLVFRVFPNLADGSKKIAELIKKETTGKIAVITEISSFTVGIKNSFKDYFVGEDVVYEDFQSDNSDFKALLARLKSEQPVAIYLNVAVANTYQILIKQLKSFGFKARIYAYHLPSEKIVQQNLGKIQAGVKYLAVPDNLSASGSYQEFYSRLTNVSNDFIAQTSYDSLNFLLEAISYTGPDVWSVKDYFLTNSFSGALGDVKFNQNGDISGVEYIVKEIK